MRVSVVPPQGRRGDEARRRIAGDGQGSRGSKEAVVVVLEGDRGAACLRLGGEAEVRIVGAPRYTRRVPPRWSS